MRWLELSVEADPEFVEPLFHIFNRYGSGGAVIENSDSFNPDEGEMPRIDGALTIRAYLPIDENTQDKRSRIEVGVRLVNHVHPIDSFIVREVEEEDWETKWEEHFRPVAIGENIVISPTWREGENGEGKVVILLDPGMAFGTGYHPTTRMCLELLEGVIFGGECVLDIGCGSGILSIAAVKLGADSSIGVDIDKVSTEVAVENCKINGVSDEISVVNGPINQELISGRKFDVVLANISSKVIIDVSDLIAETLLPDSRLILSGILMESLDAVRDVMTRKGIRFEMVDLDGDWCAILASMVPLQSQGNSK